MDDVRQGGISLRLGVQKLENGAGAERIRGENSKEKIETEGWLVSACHC